MMTRKRKGPGAGDAEAPKMVWYDDELPITEPTTERKGSFCREEARIIERMKPLGWLFIDARLPFTREDALRCDYVGERDLVIAMTPAAWCAWRQGAHGVAVIDRPPLIKKPNRIAPTHPDAAFSKTSGQDFPRPTIETKRDAARRSTAAVNSGFSKTPLLAME